MTSLDTTSTHRAQDDPGPTARGRAAVAPTLVVWNPSAGGGSDDDLGERRAALHDALQGHGVEAEVHESGSEADTERRVDAAIEAGTRRIVAAGGDGTVRSIAFRLLGQDVALGILPLGTAMNVARSVGLPLDLDAAAAVLATGIERAIDVGEVRGRPFLEIASVGLGADVLAHATEVGEGRLHMAIDGLRNAVRYRRTRARLQLDGREVRSRLLSLAVANGPFTGRGLELAPEAKLDDGKLDVLLFEGFGGVGLALHLARLVLGRKDDARIRRYRASTVRISTHRPLPIRLDSQDMGTTPVELTTRRGALRVVVPAP